MGFFQALLFEHGVELLGVPRRNVLLWQPEGPSGLGCELLVSAAKGEVLEGTEGLAIGDKEGVDENALWISLALLEKVKDEGEIV